jgi:hypothetical protein
VLRVAALISPPLTERLTPVLETFARADVHGSDAMFAAAFRRKA